MRAAVEMADTWNQFAASLPHSIGFTSKLPSHLFRPSRLLLPSRGSRCTTSRHRRGSMLSLKSQADDTSSQSEQQQVDVSVLRFTLGIPGLDESYLPRYLGIGFGSLLVLNHFVGSASPTTAQLTTEALGILLAAFSTTVPYIGRFLKGASPVDRSVLPKGNKQTFIMSENLLDSIKEDLAWESFVLLRNTNTVSVLISFQGALCIRGYWNTPDSTSKADILEWFSGQIEEIGLTKLNDTLYFPQNTNQLWSILPKGASSLLLQPVLGTNQSFYKNENANGFILLVSNSPYAYRDRDRAWIRAIAKKFGGI